MRINANDFLFLEFLFASIRVIRGQPLSSMVGVGRSIHPAFNYE
jgi:hypothetical protein